MLSCQVWLKMALWFSNKWEFKTLWTLIWNNILSNLNLSHEHNKLLCLRQDWLNLAMWFWKRNVTDRHTDWLWLISTQFCQTNIHPFTNYSCINTLSNRHICYNESCFHERIMKVKVAHHTWIKILKLRRNSLMMNNKVTYDRYEFTKSKWKSFFGIHVNITFKNLFQ